MNKFKKIFDYCSKTQVCKGCCIVLLFVGIMIFQFRWLNHLQAKVEILSDHQQVAHELDTYEQALRQKALASLPVEPEPVRVYVKEEAPKENKIHTVGFLKFDGSAAMLINGEVYNEGDTFDHYKILKIFDKSAQIVDKRTDKVEFIYFNQDREKRYAQVKKTIINYIDQKMKNSGNFEFYDDESEKMRQLELIYLSEKIRQFGCLNIITGKFRDIQTEEAITIDIQVEDKKNVLTVDTLRIRNISKVQEISKNSIR